MAGAKRGASGAAAGADMHAKKRKLPGGGTAATTKQHAFKSAKYGDKGSIGRSAGAAKGHAAVGKGGHPAPTAAAPIKLTKQEQKQARADKLAKCKKNFSLIQDIAHSWERMRQHNVSKEERSALVTDVLSKVKGRIAALASSHVASRVIQSCAKHGSPAERAAMLGECLPVLPELAKSPYGHFVAAKLVATAPKESVPELLKATRAALPALLRHPTGCSVVDELYNIASAAQRDEMAAQFYGKEFALFELPAMQAAAAAAGDGGKGAKRGGGDALGAVLEAAPAARKRAVVQNMATQLQPIMEKALLAPALTHRLLLEYVRLAPAGAVADAVALLSGEPLLRVVHTREGAALGCAVLAYGSAKDRKKVVKAMKGHVRTMATDEHAHLVLCTALRVVDDTALLKKVVGAELQEHVAELAPHKHGHRVFLSLLAPAEPRLWAPSIACVLAPPPKPLTAAAISAAGAAAAASFAASAALGAGGRDSEGEEEEDEEEEDGDDGAGGEGEEAGGGGGGDAPPAALGVSKKDDVVRRREVLAGGLGRALAAAAAAGAGAWLRSGPGSEVAIEAAAGGRQGVLADACDAQQLAALHDAIAAEAARPAGDDHVLTNFFGSRALRRLALAAAAGEAGAADAVAALWRGALAGRAGEWAGGHGAKVLAAVVQCGVPEVADAARKELAAVVGSDVDAWAQGFCKAPGAQQAAGGSAAKGKGAQQAAGSGAAKGKGQAGSAAKGTGQRGSAAKGQAQGGSAAKGQAQDGAAAQAGRKKARAGGKRGEGGK